MSKRITMSMLDGMLEKSSRKTVTGTIERIALRTAIPGVQTYAILLQGDPVAYGVVDKGTSAAFPVGISEKGDDISFEVDASGKGVSGTFRNLTVERNAEKTGKPAISMV